MFESEHIQRWARDYALSIAFWLPLSLVVGAQSYYLQHIKHLPVLLSDSLTLYAVRYLTVGILTPPLFRAVARWPVSAGTALYRVSAYALGYLPFVASFAVIRWCLLPPWSEETLTWQSRTLSTLFSLAYSTAADLLLLYLGVLIAAHAHAYFVLGRRREIERLELRHALAQSELQSLRAQLHPHFLFNTLQGISTLIDSGPATAQTMLRALADLLRTILRYGNADLIPCREELGFVSSYLELERMRLGRRLEVRWHIESGVHDALIPQMLLLPLIENALVHGASASSRGGWVEVGAAIRGDRLWISIRNSIARDSKPGLGVGIRNTEARLRHLYATDARFLMQIQREQEIAVAEVVLPAFVTIAEHQRAVAPLE